MPIRLAAITGMQGSSDWAYSSLLVLIIFIWTPPHFWALAIKYKDDYARAEVPMLPVVASYRHTAVQIVLYTVAVWALSLAFGAAAGLGAIFLPLALLPTIQLGVGENSTCEQLQQGGPRGGAPAEGGGRRR